MTDWAHLPERRARCACRPGVFRIGGDAPRALTIEQAELGLIWRHGTTGLDATLFASRFPDISLPDLSLDPTTGAVRIGAYQAAARTIGLEVAAGAAPCPACRYGRR